MGYTYMVFAWVEDEDSPKDIAYHYVEVYAGEDFDEALAAMKKAKADGAGCVKLEWRG